MKTKKRINAALLIAAASLTFSSSAWSLGLGDATVESFLNRPLQVKIDLISRESDDMATVTARLASASDYELIGASLESIAVPIHFAVEDLDGDAYILATSELAVTNPVVRLIVEVNWSSGRLLREYTIFLDPPTISESAPIPRVDKRQSPPPAATPAQPAETSAVASPEAPVEKEAPDTTAREPAEGEYGPVGNGETLWEIASNWSSGTGLAINQVMIAIKQENPQAFIKDNINLLKRGAILRMPRVEDVRAISAAAANQAVTQQWDEVRGRASSPTAASPSTPLLATETAIPEVESPQEPDESLIGEEPAAEESVSGEGISEDVATPEPELSPQLELVPPSEDSDLDSAYGFEESENDGTDVTIAVSALREDLARTEEDLITQQQQNEYLAERIKELESQLASTEQGNVESADLANMEDRLREERLAEAAAEQKKETSWYSRLSGWLIGLLILAAAVTGWWFSRRKAAATYAEDQQIREIKDEAEELLRVLDDSEDPGATGEAVDAADKQDESDRPESDVTKPEATRKSPKPASKNDEDAELLDEESSDPEIQLDLARAYISMGDKEAARVILEEVGNHGNEEQRKEAKKMLDLLIP